MPYRDANGVLHERHADDLPRPVHWIDAQGRDWGPLVPYYDPLVPEPANNCLDNPQHNYNLCRFQPRKALENMNTQDYIIRSLIRGFAYRVAFASPLWFAVAILFILYLVMH